MSSPVINLHAYAATRSSRRTTTHSTARTSHGFITTYGKVDTHEDHSFSDQCPRNLQFWLDEATNSLTATLVTFARAGWTPEKLAKHLPPFSLDGMSLCAPAVARSLQAGGHAENTCTPIIAPTVTKAWNRFATQSLACPQPFVDEADDLMVIENMERTQEILSTEIHPEFIEKDSTAGIFQFRLKH